MEGSSCYCSIAEYRIPVCRESAELERLRANGDDAALLARCSAAGGGPSRRSLSNTSGLGGGGGAAAPSPSAAASAASNAPIPGAAIELALQAGDTRRAAMLLGAARAIDWRLCAPWVTIVRTRSPEVLRFALLQPRLTELAGRGYVVREAVENDFVEAMQRVLELPNVDPNHGGPLHAATTRGDVAALRALCSHPRVAVNAFTPAHGTTALCQAIITGAEDAFCFLLAHPRIDVNRGFLFTPLQLCVLHHRLSFARLLLSRPAVHVNKAGCATAPPLWMALEAEQRDMAALLLRDGRVMVEEDLIDRLEATGDADGLQQIADAEGGAVRWGMVWRRHRANAVAAVSLEFIGNLLELTATVAAGRAGLPTYSVLLLVAHLLFAFGTCLRATTAAQARERPWCLLRLVPFVPLLEALRLLQLVRAASLTARAVAFGTIRTCSTLAALRSLVALLVHLGCLSRAANFRGLLFLVGTCIVVLVVQIAVVARLRRSRVRTDRGQAGYVRL